MSEIQRWGLETHGRGCGCDITGQKDGYYVSYLDHLAAIEALKASYEEVPMSMGEHAEAITKIINQPDIIDDPYTVNFESLKDAIEYYLDERFIGIAEKDDKKLLRAAGKIRDEILNQEHIIERIGGDIDQLYPRGTIHGLLIALSILKEEHSA